MKATWQTDDGLIRLYHGDCAHVVPHLSDIDAVVTSPPYNQMSCIPEKASGLWGKTTGGAGFIKKWNEAGYEDDSDEAAYQDWINELFASIAGACNQTASLFFNHQLRWRDGACLHPIQWFTPKQWRLRTEIVWDRGGGMMLNARMFVRFDERILWFCRSDCWKWNQDSVGLGTIWRIARIQQQQGKIHPVQFPVEIPDRCIAATTEAGDTVFDPFMGSGTVGVSCIRNGRRFVGCEKDAGHFESAVKRIQSEINRAPLFDPPPLVERSLFGDPE